MLKKKSYVANGYCITEQRPRTLTEGSKELTKSCNQLGVSGQQLCCFCSDPE